MMAAVALWRALMRRFSRAAPPSQAPPVEPKQLVLPEPLELIAGRVLSVAPTMAGFIWNHPAGRLPPGMPGDGWCVRDAMCALFGWPAGSAEWRAFVEGPHPEDMSRLEAHLGLVHVDTDLPADVTWFYTNNSHPGLLILNIDAFRRGHVIYSSDLRQFTGIPQPYRALGATLRGFLVDVRQPTP
jgi:hypothetical protein